MLLTILSISTTVNTDSDYEDAITICIYNEVVQHVKFSIGCYEGEFERSLSSTRLGVHMIEDDTPAVIAYQKEKFSNYIYTSIFDGLNEVLRDNLSSKLDDIYVGQVIEINDDIGLNVISQLKPQFISYLDLATITDLELSLYAVIAQGKVGFESEVLEDQHYAKYLNLIEQFNEFKRIKVDFSAFNTEGLRAKLKCICDATQALIDGVNFYVPFFSSRFDY